VDPVPDPLLLRKSGSAGDRTRDLCICSQKLWPLDHRGGPKLVHLVGFIIRLYHDARSPERQIRKEFFVHILSAVIWWRVCSSGVSGKLRYLRDLRFSQRWCCRFKRSGYYVASTGKQLQTFRGTVMPKFWKPKKCSPCPQNLRSLTWWVKMS